MHGVGRMLDDTLTLAFARLGFDKHELAKCLGADWVVEGDCITDHLPGGTYEIEDGKVYVVHEHPHWSQVWK